MIPLKWRPLPAWPGARTPDYRRRLSPFKASLTDTFDLLERELRHLGASDIVINADFRERDLRSDGWPKADARQPTDPGVLLAFDKPEQRGGSKVTRLQFKCDRFRKYEANLRAIALTLEALRMINRYETTSQQEQYTGFRALPAQSGSMGIEKAARVLVDAAWADRETVSVRDYNNAVHLVASSPADYEVFRRTAMARTHPDSNGGHTTEAFQRVQQAAQVLGTHHRS